MNPLTSTWLRRSLLVSSLLVAAAALHAQPYPYAGSDNFNDNSLSASWDFGYAVTGTTSGWFTETNSRLEFTSTGSNQSRALVWNNSINNAYTENWTAQLTVTNLTSLSAGYSLIGLQVFASNSQNLGLFGAYAYNSASTGTNLMVERGYGSSYTLTSARDTDVTDVTDLTVRMTHNAATHDITVSYSTDGATFYDSIVYNPSTAWSGAPTDGFSFRILALSSVDAISAGQLYADNFSVTAVPEPSTYAALAGLGAFGLVLWRRRQARLNRAA